MSDFLRIFCLIGLPYLAFAAWTIWKPVASRFEPRLPTAARVVAPLAILFACAAPLFGLPVILLALRLLPRRPADSPVPPADRVGWTIFAAGLALMLCTFQFSVSGQWLLATRRLHARIFLGFAASAVAGPMAAYLLGLRPARKARAVDPLDAPIGTGLLD